MRARKFISVFTVGALLLTTELSHAVILYGTADPAANTSAPTGALAGSGWQYEGQFGGFLGTPIGSNYFITAKHIGGSVGQTFTFNGTNYTTSAVSPDPTSDLQIWQISGLLPSHAPLYMGATGSEMNLGLVVFGRGTQRGNPVLVGSDSHLGGWLWGSSDGVERWGTNNVESVITAPGYGKLLRATFDANVGVNEAHLSSGDSGGAVFVFDSTNSRWELAGINLAVDGPFSTSSIGANAFNAALFDTMGLFVQSDQGNWIAAPNPSAFYATEIAAHRGFIESVIMQLVSVVSRKAHGNAGTFDVDLPETGQPGIEDRSGGATNSYTLVLTFLKNVSAQSATVSAGTGSVSNFTVVANQITVNLIGVANAQTVTVALGSVNDGINTSDVEVNMRILVGDTNGDGFVDSADIGQTKSQSGQAVTGANFREDVNVDGFLDSADIGFVKSHSGTALSARPTSADSTSTILIQPLPTEHKLRSVHSRAAVRER